MRRRTLVRAATVSLAAGAAPLSFAAARASTRQVSYDDEVLADGPVGYWNDASGNAAVGPDAELVGSPGSTVLPNGDPALLLNGQGQYAEIADDPRWSVVTTGELTVEAWIRPDVLVFPVVEGSGYVYWAGKNVFDPQNQSEWACRMYSKGNSEDRDNRTSGYCFNLSGGLGAGSYFQDELTAGEWIHYTLVINTNDTSTEFPTGYTRIYRDSEPRDQDSLADYDITPEDGTAPVRIGSATLDSFFLGAIGKFAIYDRELPADRILAHHNAMLAR